MACLHQIFKSDDGLKIRPHGWGNCSICTPDEKNRECPGFVGIALMTITIKNRKGRVSSIVCEGGGDDQKTAEAEPEEEV